MPQILNISKGRYFVTYRLKVVFIGFVGGTPTIIVIIGY